MNYWQVAAGTSGRDYSDVFLRYGVMLIGPGRLGPLSENRELYKEHQEGTHVLRFVEQVKCGDHVILKRPHRKQWHIVAVGRVTSEYEWLEQFEDVEGWDLQHVRRVEWVKANPPELVTGLTQGRIIRVSQSQKEPIGAAKRLVDEGGKIEAIEVPPPAKPLSEEDLVTSLIGNGLRPADAEAVIRAIWHVRRLARWYASYGLDISEHEVRAFLIVPILLALGWSEQRIKIEWKQTDVSLFSAPFRRDANREDPHVILESKRMGTGLDHAESQVRRYARDFPRCNMLVTSTGVRYQLYRKEPDPNQKWDASNMKEKHLSASLNLFNLKDRHPYMANVGGAPDLFKSLMPG